MTGAEIISVARIARVNHAGEYGAIRIYGAQHAFARLFWPNVATKIAELRGHEVEHCRLFREAMRQRNIRPCRAMYLWSFGGYALGAVTAVLGPKMIWACTEAVEDAVHHHLAAQLHYLHTRDAALFALVKDIQSEEEGHLSLAIAEKGAPSRLTRVAEAVVRVSVHCVVWLSTWGGSTRMRRDLRVAA
ncbi:MAG TPA: demethoxyubiquinone hydroxylase family protein [Tabrizicola sp.]|nr:demethoxyubiquinone hydroxylase family protein [Tabrizicola sp.]